MYRLYFVVWPLIFLTLAWSQPGSRWETRNCPRKCTCMIERSLRKVYCDIQDKQHLRAIPSRFPANSQYITLKGNRISRVPVGAFANLGELRHLDLASNEVESLPQNVFQGLSSLETLNLSKNRLGQLPSGLLHGLNSLRDLYLDGNVLDNLPKDFFQGLTSLRRLYLDSNKFYTLSHNLFGFRGKMNKYRTPTSTVVRNLTSLEELLLNHNGIGQVQKDSFNKMSDLRRLKLNDNNITTLPRGIFRDLKSLRLLSLYKNPFQCTCSLKWLKDWIVQNRKHITVFHPHLIKCHGPSRLRGESLLQVADREFGCKDNAWGKWSSWGSCSKTCDNGLQSRTRKCTLGAGGCEGSKTERQWCNTHKCDPGWSNWTVWTPCSVTCAVGYQTRSRSTQCTESPCQRQLESEVRACPRKACPSYTEWSSWSMCDTVCGRGTQVRKRECTTSHLGLECHGTKTETQRCKIRECATWAEWGGWSSCSKSCSKGEQTRKRDCVIVYGLNTKCEGNNIDTRDCHIKPCEVDGGWSTWSSWGNCSKACGIGYNTRYRRCSNPYPRHGGAQCKGPYVGVTQCIRGICTGETSEFTPWSRWSPCSKQCGTGTQFQRRTCLRKDNITGVDMCLGTSIAIQSCVGDRCDRKWGEWTPWGKCEGECYNGVALRMRVCVDDQGQGGYTCTGNKTNDFQLKSCKPLKCSQSPVWTSWNRWSECSKSCAGGTRRRLRYCVTKIIGKTCPGNQESKEQCNKHNCPIDGGWSSWSEWGECDQGCEGIKRRYRTCTQPELQYNGHGCIGDSKDMAVCPKTCSEAILNDGSVKSGEITLDNRPECPNPAKPENGKYTIKTQKDGHKFLEYKCDEYYRNQGVSKFRYCTDKGIWSGAPAECEPDCGEIKESDSEKRQIEMRIQNMTDFWPWQVIIQVPVKGKICGGTLIKDQWVLTAAHCVLKDRHSMQHQEEIKVFLGTNNLTDESSPQVQVMRVAKIESHKDFDYNLVNSDIAILKLEKKVYITKYVHPVCLPRGSSRQRHRFVMRPGRTGVMVGWGSPESSLEKHLLRQIPLPIVRLQDCEKSYKKASYKVTKKMLCAGYKNKGDGTCKKDSGGGFVFLHKIGRKKRWVLGGIVSWRYPDRTCRSMGKYSVFTDVTEHIAWIDKKIKSEL